MLRKTQHIMDKNIQVRRKKVHNKKGPIIFK